MILAIKDGISVGFQVTSAWTIGNLAGSGPKACELLSVQGAITELCNLLPNGNEEIREAALYALVHFAYQLRDRLRYVLISDIIIITATKACGLLAHGDGYDHVVIVIFAATIRIYK